MIIDLKWIENNYKTWLCVGGEVVEAKKKFNLI